MRNGTGVDRRRRDALVSVVVPLYNEAEVLEELVASLVRSLDELRCRRELIFVNDGSCDESATILDALAAEHPDVRVLHLSRNFGHQASIQAGLSHARGDVVIVMDADLQDDPASIGPFLTKWREGFDVVYGIRTIRKEGLLKRALFASFYRVFHLVSRVSMPLDAGTFSLVDREVARQIASLGERDRYYAGLRSWLGYRQIGVPLERGARYDGRPRVSLSDLWRLAKSAIVSFSYLPLTIFYGIALIAMLVFIGLGAFTVYHKVVSGLAILGWTSTVMTACFFGAINALGIAILGEYVLRIYDQVRARPVFIVERSVNFVEDVAGAAPS
jgi:glycosyltransferase involved in cell wall biosynthesis